MFPPLALRSGACPYCSGSLPPRWEPGQEGCQPSLQIFYRCWIISGKKAGIEPLPYNQRLDTNLFGFKGVPSNLLRNIRLRNYLGILRQSDVSEEIKGIIQIFQQKILQNAIRNYTVTYQLGIACEEFQKLLNINTSESFQEIATQYKVNITKEGRVDCKATFQQFKK